MLSPLVAQQPTPPMALGAGGGVLTAR